jgi:hypothetical protein
MATVTANFTVPANTPNGGRLQGAGFGATAPRMNRGDVLNISVNWAGSNTPGSLTAYLIISPVQTSNQTAPSPFVNNGNYVCFLALSGNKAANGSQYSFSSQLLTIPSNAVAGQYELTLVVENEGTQWSEDPEFDTTGA